MVTKTRVPRGWVTATLSEICLPVETVKPDQSPNELFSYIDIGAIEDNRVVATSVVRGREAPSRARQVVRRGDILFSTVRTYLKKIALVEEEYPNALASTGFVVIRPAPGVLPEFLFYQFLSKEFLAPINALQSGTSYPAVRRRDVLGRTVVLASIEEQERIVVQLRDTLGGLERAEKASERAKQKLEQYRRGVQYAGVTGELTRIWREKEALGREDGIGRASPRMRSSPAQGERESVQFGLALDDSALTSAPASTELPEIPATWTWTRLADIAQIGTGISVSQNRRLSKPLALPYLRVANVLRGRLDLSDVKTIRIDADRVERHLLKQGDVLFTEGGDRDKLGRGWVWEGQLPRCLHQNHIFRARPHDPSSVNPKLISHWANTFGQQFFDTHGTQTTNLASISRGVLSQLPIPLAPPGEQREILRQIQERLKAADMLESRLDKQIQRAREARETLINDAFSGVLVRSESTDSSAVAARERAVSTRRQEEEAKGFLKRQRSTDKRMPKRQTSANAVPTTSALRNAFERIGQKPDARRLFVEAGYTPEGVTAFYESLLASPQIRTVFEADVAKGRRPKPPKLDTTPEVTPAGRFRLATLWLENFKNLKDYTIRFDVGHGLDVILGWNGTGKSNLFEALVIIFRDLNDWVERNRWPDEPMSGYHLSYEIEDKHIEVAWNPMTMKRPAVTASPRLGKTTKHGKATDISREELVLPRFVFGYYSGPTNRLAEHFLPMKQAHYVRLRKAKTDDAATLSRLLQQRRFFCAETHHAKYVLLAFSHKEDAKMSAFLRERLRIIGFESALFVIRRPAWAQKGSGPEDFWGATGIMRRVMERLRRYAIAPMVLKQQISDGYRTSTEDHYYFLLPDLQSLHAFAAEYEDARTFFLALESTDFSELIHDVKIQVSVRSADSDKVSITFHQMSEGEQQLLMVLGLMRFTKSHQSLVLLDEPDTHLNPHWSIGYLKDLTKVMSDTDLEAPEQQTSQLLMATHDPLVIASLVKEQIHLLTRDAITGACKWVPASINPRGLGFTGILTSEMFGFRSDLDEETLADLDTRVRLIARSEDLSAVDRRALEETDRRLDEAGFSKAFSDPYYSAFVRAWGRRHSHLMAGKQFLNAAEQQEVDRVAAEVLAEAVAEVENEDTP